MLNICFINHAIVPTWFGLPANLTMPPSVSLSTRMANYVTLLMSDVMYRNLPWMSV